MVAHLGRCESQKIAGKFRRARVRIIVEHGLELLVGFAGPVLGGGEAWQIGLCRSAWRPQRGIQGAHRQVQFTAGLLILPVEVEPAAKSASEHYGQHYGGNDEFRLVFRGPVDSGLGGAEGGPAESVLFELMTGFCAHERPFYKI